MRPFLWSRIVAVSLASLLLVSPCAFAQETPQTTRPRRVQTSPTEISKPAAPVEMEALRLTEEPVLRIGLATTARSVNISTTGRLLNVTESSDAPVPLATARVRLEPRMLTPQVAPAESETFRVEITGAATSADAERASREIHDLTGDDSEIAYDAATDSWPIRVGPGLDNAQAEELRARLEEAGFAPVTVVQTQNSRTSNPSSARAVSTLPSSSTIASHPSSTSVQTRSPSSTVATRSPSPNTKASASMPALVRTSGTGRIASSSSSSANNVRSISRASMPTRELVVYAVGRSMLFSSRAPVTFASDDERNAPMRFNDKPYRGRLEVFTNPGGSLTVVNVIRLEDYVRGVVPNELSPGGYGAIEALKAQAVAARTYAVKNRGNFAAQGFDLLPTTRSQVYGGMSTEHPLSTRAVEETRGIIATYKGEPINALYTSTCGGRTEDAENIFSEAEPYLRSRECAPEGRAAFVPFIIKSSRELADILEEQNVTLARDAALLAIHDFKPATTRITDTWLSAPASIMEVRGWLASVARLSHQPVPVLTDDAARPPGFSTALAAAVYGEGRADTLLDNADVEYLLAFRDASEIPAHNRADVALLLRDGVLSLYPDASLQPRGPMPRARILHAITRILEARGALQLQKATTRPATSGALILRSSKGQDQPLVVSADAYLFRALGDGVARQVRSLVLVGGEPATFHVNARGEVDYLEVRPAPNGAASDRFSPFTNWTSELSLAEAQSRLSRAAYGIGSLRDLRVAARGSSRRVTDLEITGTSGTTHLRGGRIRSILGLREQLFVIDRKYDATGRVMGFIFTGRGWGHGVGMCQVGAYGMARAGRNYEQILKAYYTGIELTKMY